MLFVTRKAARTPLDHEFVSDAVSILCETALAYILVYLSLAHPSIERIRTEFTALE